MFHLERIGLKTKFVDSKLGLGESIEIITFRKLFYYHDHESNKCPLSRMYHVVCACAKG